MVVAMIIKTRLTAVLCLGLALLGCEKMVYTPISGSASKGIISGGEVAIYPITDDGIIGAEPIATGKTTAKGKFEFDVPISDQNAVYIEVQGRDDGTTLMFCDLQDCGIANDSSLDINQDGIVNFGEWCVIGPEFKLTAYALPPINLATLNINVLTHVIAQKYTTAPTEAELSTEYTQLQQQLNLASSPSAIEPLDLSGDIELSQTQLQDNIIMLAVVERFNSSADVSDAIVNMTDDFLVNNTVVSAEHSFTDITADAILFTGAVVANIDNTVLPQSVKTEVESQLRQSNRVAAQDENQLEIDDLPISPPNF